MTRALVDRILAAVFLFKRLKEIITHCVNLPLSRMLWVDPPGQVWADDVHDVDEFVRVVEGDVEFVFEIEGKVHRPAQCEELFIAARARHTVRSLGPGESHLLDGDRR